MTFGALEVSGASDWLGRSCFLSLVAEVHQVAQRIAQVEILLLLSAMSLWEKSVFKSWLDNRPLHGLCV